MSVISWKKVISAISRNIVLHIAILTIFFWLYHRFAAHVIKDLHIKLGVITSLTVPLYAKLHTHFSLWVIPAIVSLIAYIVIFRIILEKRKVPVYIFPIVFMLMLVLIDTTVAMIDGGLKALTEPYNRKTMEYYMDVPKVKGIRVFLRDYVKIFNSLSWHARTHPPGGVLFLWIASRLFGKGLLPAALSTVAFTSLTVIPVYFLAKHLYGEKVAKYSLGLFLITPNMVLFTATGMDGPFSVFPILSVYLFYKALSGRTVLYSILMGITMSLAMLMNYTIVVIVILFTMVAVITLISKREKMKNILIALSIAGITFVFFYLFLYLWAKFSIISAVRAAYKRDEATMGTGYENIRRYFNVSLVNLFGFLIGVGIPLTTVWLHEIVAEFRRIISSRRVDLYILPFFLTLILISFCTLFTTEVERIWIFLVPFIVIPAAKHLHEKHSSWGFYIVAILLCAQILLTEIFLDIYW